MFCNVRVAVPFIPREVQREEGHVEWSCDQQQHFGAKSGFLHLHFLLRIECWCLYVKIKVIVN